MSFVAEMMLVEVEVEVKVEVEVMPAVNIFWIRVRVNTVAHMDKNRYWPIDQQGFRIFACSETLFCVSWCRI